MAYNIQQAVIDFHQKFGHPVRDTPQLISREETELAYGFIDEEFNELYEALGNLIGGCGERNCNFPMCKGEPNLVEIADAGGDIIVTTVGLMVRMGIDVNMVLKEIMDSNMTKEANGQGKIKKGADYKAPDIARVLGV